MAAINQDGELHFLGPADIAQSVECRSRCAATEQNIIHQNNDLVGDIRRN
jgi:hypothetical protein